MARKRIVFAVFVVFVALAACSEHSLAQSADFAGVQSAHSLVFVTLAASPEPMHTVNRLLRRSDVAIPHGAPISAHRVPMP